MVKKEIIKIINDAIKMNASDIHFTLNEDESIMIQFRAGNIMLPRGKIDRDLYEKILGFIRFHSAMDLSHPLQPQSGSLIIQEKEDTISCRVSILPTTRFRSLVLRVINVKNGKSLDEIPLFNPNIALLKEIAQFQAGLILIGGPTSSGKTTTAYAMIDYLKNELSKSIITIEDPIEYQHHDIVQMQVNESAGMSYEIGIKEILRHDPDVIVIGEIRDKVTAANAIRAALTGHLVISTIHSKDNLGTIHRLMDLEVSLTEINQAVTALINQRLVPSGVEKKALFEICYGNDLENIMEQVIEGNVIVVPYTTLDEEFLKWRQQQK